MSGKLPADWAETRKAALAAAQSGDWRAGHTRVLAGGAELDRRETA